MDSNGFMTESAHTLRNRYAPQGTRAAGGTVGARARRQRACSRSQDSTGVNVSKPGTRKLEALRRAQPCGSPQRGAAAAPGAPSAWVRRSSPRRRCWRSARAPRAPRPSSAAWANPRRCVLPGRHALARAPSLVAEAARGGGGGRVARRGCSAARAREERGRKKKAPPHHSPHRVPTTCALAARGAALGPQASWGVSEGG